MKPDFYWLNSASRTFLSRGYLTEGETAETRIRDIGNAAQEILGIDGFANKFFKYMSRGYYALSSPVWANFGKQRGLPISCNGVFVGDTIESIVDKNSEIAIQTKLGAGTSAFFGAIRPRGTEISTGGFADGPVSFMPITETYTTVISQSNVRRGTFAAYMPVEHPDCLEFLNSIREVGAEIQKMNIGVTITNKWMDEMLKELTAMQNHEVGEYPKVDLWLRILQKRAETGYPYIIWHDAINSNKPQVYKDRDMTIWASNVCTEIALPSTEEESFVCNLSSMNIEQYDEWSDTDAVETLVYFLDAVMTEYIDKTDNIKHMTPANRFARNHRAIGVSILGWHSYLQSKMVPFESFEAKMISSKIMKEISEHAEKSSRKLATMFGEPLYLKGYGLRNTTQMALAPTTSSSFILGQVSQSFEPWQSNYITKELAKGVFTIRNPHLMEVLDKHGENTENVWASILEANGSVQHLDFLSEREKMVFKTFSEISQLEVVQQAAQRQQFVDQTQSVNLMIDPDTTAAQLHDLHVMAWKRGVVSLYYLKTSSNSIQAKNRDLMGCVSCEA